MITFPPCKINLGLNIISKRSDGYHNIETCFYQVPWTDILEILPSTEFTFSSSGDSIPGNIADNLCVKAYHLLQKDFQLTPVKIHLHKTIPTGAGLGGGSSDAAFTLKILKEIFSLPLSNQDLQVYAAQLGSDCAYFIKGVPMIGSGRGEVLHEINLDLKGKYIIIVKPDVHISTAEAYAGVTPHQPGIHVEKILTDHSIKEWKELLVNDFERSVFAKYPEIKRIKDVLYEQGALYASMSGSGSSVFGIFSELVKVEHHFPATKFWSGFL